jgi:hypothetical protein
VPCYNSSAKIRAFMHSQGWSTDCPVGASKCYHCAGNEHCVGYKYLIAFFLRHVQALAKKHGRTPSGWQEIYDHFGGNTSATPTPRFAGIDADTVRDNVCLSALPRVCICLHCCQTIKVWVVVATFRSTCTFRPCE